jgi:hypothetical protein
MRILCKGCRVALHVSDDGYAYCEGCESRFRVVPRKAAGVSFSHRAACATLLVAVLVLWAWRQL